MIKIILSVILLASSLFEAALVNADVLTRTMTLISATNRTTTVTGTISSLAAVTDYRGVGGIACRAVASNDSGTSPTLDIVVQTCKDETAASCDTICTFTQCTTGSCWSDSSATIDLGTTVNVYPYVRAVATLGGTSPQYDILVELVY